jgi:hypothetical protein
MVAERAAIDPIDSAFVLSFPERVYAIEVDHAIAIPIAKR